MGYEKIVHSGGDSFLYEGRAQDVIPSLDNESIDVVFTSPPYKDQDGYTDELMREVFAAVYPKLKKDGVMFINFGHMKTDKFRYMDVGIILRELGFKPMETFTWWKNHFKPIQGERTVNNTSEFILMVSKTKLHRKLDRWADGVPFADPSNIRRFKGNAGRDVRCAGNVWPVSFVTRQKTEQLKHEYEYPVELVARGLRLAKVGKGDVVLDPFMGSATTGEAARDQGASFVGVELDPEVYGSAVSRLAVEVSEESAP